MTGMYLHLGEQKPSYNLGIGMPLPVEMGHFLGEADGTCSVPKPSRQEKVDIWAAGCILIDPLAWNWLGPGGRGNRSHRNGDQKNTWDFASTLGFTNSLDELFRASRCKA